MEVLIILNGDLNNLGFFKNLITEATYVICADGAARYLISMDITPDLLVGDLDSIAKEDLAWMKQKGVEVKKFPARKDFTDSELALEYALELNPLRVTIIGGVGSRWDHSLGNVMLLYKMLNNGVYGRLINEKNELTIVDGELTISGEPGDILSIIPITKEVRGVTLKGLEYPLTDHNFQMGDTLGISNQLATSEATVTIREGIILVCRSKD